MDYPWSGPDLALALWMCYVWTYLPRCVVVSSLLLRCTPVQILFMGLANIQFLEADGFSWSPIEPSEHGFWQTFHVMDVKQESSCLSASHHGQRKTIRVPSGILHVHAVEGERERGGGCLSLCGSGEEIRPRSLIVQNGIPVWECWALGDHVMSLSFFAIGPLIMCSLGQPARSLHRMPRLDEIGCFEEGVRRARAQAFESFQHR